MDYNSIDTSLGYIMSWISEILSSSHELGVCKNFLLDMPIQKKKKKTYAIGKWQIKGQVHANNSLQDDKLSTWQSAYPCDCLSFL